MNRADPASPASPAPPARQARVAEVIEDFVAALEPLQHACNEALWSASVTGLARHVEEHAGWEARIRALCSRDEPCGFLREVDAAGGVPDPLLQRQLVVLLNLLRAHQMPAATIEKMVELERRVGCRFNDFRAEINGVSVSGDRIGEILRESTDPPARRQAWEASKQIGREVVDDLLELVRLRNAVARAQGFADYYTMMLELDELDAGEVLDLLNDLERGTQLPFAAYRRKLDEEFVRRFGDASAGTRPWHFSDPFFEGAPVAGFDPDSCFAGRDLVRIATDSFAALGFPLRDLLARSDLRDRECKSPHAFCLSMDRAGDVRVFCDVRPTESAMGVLLHEIGHAIYEQAVDRSLPYLLRAPAHTLTTEASAMLFGRQSRNPEWLARHAGLDAAEAGRARSALSGGARAQLLVQIRWSLVMCHMERELYRDPSRDLDSLWWDLVERFQWVERPAGRCAPDWASKIHFSVAPVYYHNYALGEVMASQLQRSLLDHVAGAGPGAWERCVSNPGVARFLVERLYRPGKSIGWRAAVRRSTGASLRPDALVADLEGPY